MEKIAVKRGFKDRTMIGSSSNGRIPHMSGGELMTAKINNGHTNIDSKICSYCKRSTLFPIKIENKVYCPNCAEKQKGM
jgi:hypothetical protein